MKLSPLTMALLSEVSRIVTAPDAVTIEVTVSNGDDDVNTLVRFDL